MACDFSPAASAVLLFFVSGILGTLAFKLMGSQQVQQGGHTRLFYHPYMQTFTMSFAQLLSLIYFYANLKKYTIPLEQGKTPHHFYYFLLPGFCDVSLSMLQYISLNFITGSTWRILQGGTIITTAIFSKLLLSMIIQRRHIVGCSLSIIGLVIVGISGFINTGQSSNTDFGLQILGIVLMLVSLIINGYIYAYEQLLMKRHTIHQFELVGWEGFFGIIIITIFSLMLSIIPCGLQEQLCVYDQYGHTYFQRVDQFFIEIANSWPLGVLLIVGIISVSLSNTSGLAITKYIDALARCLVGMSKTVGTWIIGIIVTASVGNNPNYQLQSLDLAVNIVKIFGFIFIIIGTLIYNQLIFNSFLADKHLQEDIQDLSQIMNGKLISQQG